MAIKVDDVVALATGGELPELLATAEAMRPVVNAIVDLVVSYGPEIKKVFEPVVVGTCDIQATAFLHLVNERGLTREEALAIVINTMARTRDAIKTSSVRVKKS